MAKQNLQLDTCGVPAWLGKVCDENRVIYLSDTRTYRLLLTIFQAIFDMSAALNDSDVDHEEEMLSFMNWFLGLGRSTTAHLGLMWVYQHIGRKAMSIQ